MYIGIGFLDFITIEENSETNYIIQEDRIYTLKCVDGVKLIETVIVDDHLNDSELMTVGNMLISDISFVLLSLWLVKDNSVSNIDLKLYNLKEKNETKSLIRSSFNTCSNGQHENIHFSAEELELSKSNLNLIEGIYITNKIEMSASNFEGLSAWNSSINLNLKSPSFERALIMLKSTIESRFVPAKIAGYISVLECLFAINKNNTISLSQRAAIFIGKTLEERKTIYKMVKTAYSRRSEYIHGSEIKNVDIIETGKAMDNLVRLVIRKMFSDYRNLNYTNKGNVDFGIVKFEEVNSFFEDIIIGGGSIE